MLSLKYKNINYVMTQILKLSCVSFSYVSISYVLTTKTVSDHDDERMFNPVSAFLELKTGTIDTGQYF